MGAFLANRRMWLTVIALRRTDPGGHSTGW